MLPPIMTTDPESGPLIFELCVFKTVGDTSILSRQYPFSSTNQPYLPGENLKPLPKASLKQLEHGLDYKSEDLPRSYGYIWVVNSLPIDRAEGVAGQDTVVLDFSVIFELSRNFYPPSFSSFSPSSSAGKTIQGSTAPADAAATEEVKQKGLFYPSTMQLVLESCGTGAQHAIIGIGTV